MKMSDYEQLKKILDNAPEEAVFWDGEDYLNKKFEYIVPISFSISGGSKIYKKYTWIRKDLINIYELRRLSDIKEIVDLMEAYKELEESYLDTMESSGGWC